MTASDRDRLERRVLVLTPTGKDGPLTCSVLGQSGIECANCFSMRHLVEELEAGAGAVLIAEESFSYGHGPSLVQFLARQPPWSDLPLVVLTRPGADSPAVLEALRTLGNVSLLERPIRVSMLLTTVRASLRARQRQYQTREHLLGLRRSTEEMRTLLDTVPVGVYMAHDSECRKITGNRTGSELLRMRAEDNVSKSAPPAERPTHFQPMRDGVPVPTHLLPMQRAARGEVVRNEEIDLVFEDGTILKTLVSASPLFDAVGNPRGAVATIFDVTPLKRAEDALREADRRKDEFLATLAHELRNPLAPIRNSLHILRLAARSDPALEEVRDMMERQVNLMVRLVDDLLEVSRITRGKIELERKPVELGTIVRNAVETSRPWIEAAGQQLAISLPTEPITLDGDPVRLAQVFANLLNNAAKYSRPEGKIVLSGWREGGKIAVSVKDTGLGIPAEMLSKVFDMFTQVDRHLGRSQGGLGIGLTLVKRLVEMHEGTIEVCSNGPGTGSEFIVRLPIADRPPASVTPSRGRPVSLLASRRVLVVDDNRDAADSLGMLLELLGADVHVVHSGPEALKALSIHKPAVVLLDIGMPGMDGLEVARQIRQQPEHRDVTLIALTGWGQEEDRIRTQSAGFDHHLTKPADPGHLESLLSEMERSATDA